MSVRRVSMIEDMFNDIASRQELLVLDELYKKGNKGSAIVFMLKRIKSRWNTFLGKPETTEVSISEKPRVFKITEQGQSRYEARA